MLVSINRYWFVALAFHEAPMDLQRTYVKHYVIRFIDPILPPNGRL